jgi:S-adenosylmethionine:tRNA ribosyltransferase-isomerase
MADMAQPHASVESTPPQPSNSTQNADSSALADDYSLLAYDYELPVDRIAQNPVSPRDHSRLLVVPDQTHHAHHHFWELPNWLQPDDLLVVNDTRVLPARLYGKKSEGAMVEVLLLEEQSPNVWLALVKPGKRLKPGAEILFSALPEKAGEWINQQQVADKEQPDEKHEAGLRAIVLAIDEATGGRILQFDVPGNQPLLSVLHQFGQIPLPPYVTESQADPEQYQTVYADRPGAVAAPTAGLHFTPELFDQLQAKGIQRAFVTLHVGVGTFRPVESENITTHQMHGEWVEVSEQTVQQIQAAKARGGRVIAVGTTVVRSLEAAAQNGELQPFCGKTNLFIYPGYQWRVVDGLITNFHLPKSSLLMLVSALIGRQRLLDLYQVAIEQHYRFYSFGDAMLILPDARYWVEH